MNPLCGLCHWVNCKTPGKVLHLEIQDALTWTIAET
jgi:hypothetical protein